MDTLLSLVSSDISKIAIFLLFFGLVALIFEVFYFRRRREQANVTTASEPTSSPASSTLPSKSKKKNFILIGAIFILLLVPVTVYLVFQQVNLQQQAQVAQPQQAIQIVYNCDKIDTLRNNVLVDSQSIAVSDTVTFVGYCYAEGAGVSGANVNRLRFTLHNPSGTTKQGTYLAFVDPSKTTGSRRYFKASFPNVKINEEGSYTLDLLAYDRNTALMTKPFTTIFSVAPSSAGAVNPTPAQAGTSSPTPLPTQTQTANKPPSCSSLSAIPLTGPAPLTVSLTGSATDSDGQVTAFEFTFGDGSKQTVNKNVGASGSASTSHAYQTAGSYKASLIVRDNGNIVSAASSLCSVQIAVTSSSTATISANLNAQPTKTITPTPTTVSLPQAGISLPMIGFVSIGLLLFTFGLLLAF